MTGDAGGPIAASWELFVEFSQKGKDTVVKY